MNNQVKPNALDIKKINPRLGDKYSPNLYKYMRKNKGAQMYARAYKDNDGHVWIGYIHEGDFIGARLNAILCNGSKVLTFCYSRFDGLEEIKSFWPGYIRIGRCAIDPEHQTPFLGDTRWEQKEGIRSCRWCGSFTQKLASRAVTKIITERVAAE